MSISFTLDKTTVSPGESVKVSWTFRNGWTSSYSFKIEFTINGSPLRTINLGTVYSGQTKSGSFTFSAPKTPGTYKVEAISYMYVHGSWLDEDSDSKSLTVKEVQQEPKAKIQYVTVNGKSVSNGGSVTISNVDMVVEVGISNVGGDGNIVTHITVKDSSGNGIYSTTKTISISSGETKEVTFSTTLPKADTYRVTVSAGH